MLQPLLQEYLIENGSLPILSKGRLIINHSPAQLQEADKMFIAPVNHLSFSATMPSETEVQKLVSFISSRLTITHEQAKELLAKESGANTSINENNDSVDWPALGLLQNKDGTIHFTQHSQLTNYLPSFSVEKIIQQPVSEPDITPASEIIAGEVIFEEEIIKKDYWWVWALVIFLLSVILILLWFV